MIYVTEDDLGHELRWSLTDQRTSSRAKRLIMLHAPGQPINLEKDVVVE